MIATPLPCRTPELRISFASAFVRAWTSLKVSVPRSSQSAQRSG